MDISIQHLSRIENGTRNASTTLLIKIAIALGVGVDSLLLDILPYDKNYGCDKLGLILSDCNDDIHKVVMDTVLAAAESVKKSLLEIRI